MPRRTKEAAQATRERLLDAAQQLFLERGVARTTLGDIAQAAGTTRGAVYWHFADKTALVQALFERVDLPMEQALQAAEHDGDLDPLTRLRRLAHEPFALMARDARARAVFVILLHRAEFSGELDDLNHRNDAAVNDCTLRMERLFEQAAGAEQLAPGVTPRAAAVALLALVDGLMRLATAEQPLVVPADGAIDTPGPHGHLAVEATRQTGQSEDLRAIAERTVDEPAPGPSALQPACRGTPTPTIATSPGELGGAANTQDPITTAIDALMHGLTSRPTVQVGTATQDPNAANPRHASA